MSMIKMKSKMMKLKRIPATICILALLIAIMGTGCGKANEVVSTTTSAKTSVVETSEQTKPALAEVNLKWYLLSNSQPDDAIVYGEANKYIKDKINANVEFIPLNGGEYNDKMKIKMASGEDMDLVFTASWLNNYMENIAKGSLLAIDDMLDTVTPNLKASLPQIYWDMVKIKKEGDDKAKIWGVPNYQIEVGLNGLGFKKDLVDKYNLSEAISNIKTMDDLTPIFKVIHDNEKDITCVADGNMGGYELDNEKMSRLSWLASCLVGDNTTFKAIDKYEDEGYLKQYTVARNWYQEGYMDKNAMLIKDFTPLRKSGKLFCTSLGSTKPGADIEFKNMFNYEIVVKTTMFPLTSQAQVTATMNGIVKASKNPERALMLLELVNTDKTLYNLLNYGIEKTHYTKIDDNTIEVLEGSKFNPSMAWALGNQFNAYVLKGQPADIWEKTKAINEKAQMAPFGSFTFNNEPVKTEMAQIDAITTQYESALISGAMDPVKYVPILVEKIKKNGNLEKVMNECQKQIDAWRATQN